MHDELLEYVDGPVNPDDEPYRSSGHDDKKIYERVVVRLFVDRRRVVVPSGFGGDMKTPKGTPPLHRMQVDANDADGLRDLFAGLKETKRRRKSIAVEHEVDGATARYRVVRFSRGGGGHGTLHGTRRAWTHDVGSGQSAREDGGAPSRLDPPPAACLRFDQVVA